MTQKVNSLWVRALKYILQKDKESISLLMQSSLLLKQEFLIIDATKKILWGEESARYRYNLVIEYDGISLGVFKSSTEEGKYMLEKQ